METTNSPDSNDVDPDRSDLHIFLGAVKKDEDFQFSHIMP
jgi:hypothetical protein